MANFGPLSKEEPNSPDVNHCVLHFRPGSHREPRSEVGYLRPAERLVGIEPGTFRFLLQGFNPLGHSPQRDFVVSLFLALILKFIIKYNNINSIYHSDKMILSFCMKK